MGIALNLVLKCLCSSSTYRNNMTRSDTQATQREGQLSYAKYLDTGHCTTSHVNLYASMTSGQGKCLALAYNIGAASAFWNSERKFFAYVASRVALKAFCYFMGSKKAIKAQCITCLTERVFKPIPAFNDYVPFFAWLKIQHNPSSVEFT
jgi:hypothetical protein